MGALIVPFLNAMQLAEGDFREGFNTHALDQGFPVREFRSKDGVIELDSQLVSVRNAEISPDLLRGPGAAGPGRPPRPRYPRQRPPPIAR